VLDWTLEGGKGRLAFAVVQVFDDCDLECAVGVEGERLAGAVAAFSQGEGCAGEGEGQDVGEHDGLEVAVLKVVISWNGAMVVLNTYIPRWYIKSRLAGQSSTCGALVDLDVSRAAGRGGVCGNVVGEPMAGLGCGTWWCLGEDPADWDDVSTSRKNVPESGFSWSSDFLGKI
jgi:hypothetical protein